LDFIQFNKTLKTVELDRSNLLLTLSFWPISDRINLVNLISYDSKQRTEKYLVKSKTKCALKRYTKYRIIEYFIINYWTIVWKSSLKYIREIAPPQPVYHSYPKYCLRKIGIKLLILNFFYLRSYLNYFIVQLMKYSWKFVFICMLNLYYMKYWYF